MHIKSIFMTYPEAENFARACHFNSFRKCGEAYINHPLRVMNILKKLGCSKDVLQGAVLHDVIETGKVKQEELCDRFGDRVGHLVGFLSKYPKVFFEEEENPKLARLQEYVERIDAHSTKFPELLVIKMADQIDNMNSLDVFTEQKREEQLNEVLHYFFPIYQQNLPSVKGHYKDVYDCLYFSLKQAAKNAFRLDFESSSVHD